MPAKKDRVIYSASYGKGNEIQGKPYDNIQAVLAKKDTVMELIKVEEFESGKQAVTIKIIFS